MTSPPEPGDREPDDGEPGDPLAGYRVLDLTTFLSGPLVTRSLADLGAEIIKIEPPSGDPTRGGATDGSGAFWWLLHRDRKSVVLDLKSDAGRQVLLSLAGEADVLLENFRPGVMDRLQLSPKQLRAIHPRLVYCTITGFGTDGPAADQTAIDGPVQAFAGMVELSTLHGLPSFPVPIPVADIAGSSAASQAILAALLARHRTGTGCHIDVSLFEAMLGWVLTNRRASLAPPVTLILEGNDKQQLIVQTPLHFRARLLELVATVAGFESFAMDSRFDSEAGVRAHAAEYTAGMRAAFATRSRDDWLAQLRAQGVPAGPVHSIDEALGHPQLDHRQAVATMGPLDEELRIPLSPFRFDGARRKDTAPPPSLGQHTAEVLHQLLGLGDDEIDRLAQAGAFGPPAVA